METIINPNNIDNFISRSSSHILHIINSDKLYITNVDFKAIRKVDLNIIGEIIDNEWNYYEDNNIFTLGYEYGRGEIELKSWNNYEKCNFYKN